MTEISVSSRETQRQIEGHLPEAKIFDLLSSVGNGENKALELIVMRQGVIYSSDVFYHEVMDHQEKDRGWKMSNSVPFQHCEDSLSPIGLVTKEALASDGNAWGYEITEYGLKTGIPFAGLLLKWSYEHPQHSLYKMFGATLSSAVKDEQILDKKRAQETRYKIFWEIVTNPGKRMRIIDVASQINKYSTLLTVHLQNLSRNNVISYDATALGKRSSYFKLKDNLSNQKPTPYKHSKTLSDRLFDLLIQLRKEKPDEFLSAEEIANSLVKLYPEYSKDKQLTPFTTGCMAHFEKQGCIERKKFDNQFRSEITFSDEQREVIVSLVTIVDKFKTGDRQTIEEGRRFAQSVANDPNLFSELMLKAKEASPFANRTNREDMQSYFLSILYENPNSTTKQIQQVLEENYDKKLGGNRIRVILSGLIREEKVVSEKTKAGNVYRVV